jgi:hypothetical protein
MDKIFSLVVKISCRKELIFLSLVCCCVSLKNSSMNRNCCGFLADSVARYFPIRALFLSGAFSLFVGWYIFNQPGPLQSVS